MLPARKGSGSRSRSRSPRPFEESSLQPISKQLRVNIQDFLLEIRTEEIPAPALLTARMELARTALRRARRGGPDSGLDRVVRHAAAPRRRPARRARAPGGPVRGSPRSAGRQRLRRRRQADEGGRGVCEGAEGRRRGSRRRGFTARQDRGRAQVDPGPTGRRDPCGDRSARGRGPDFPEDDALGRGRARVRAARARRRGALRRSRRRARALRRRRVGPHARPPRPLRGRDPGVRRRRLPGRSCGRPSSSPTARLDGS